MKDLTIKDLVTLSERKAGRERMNAIVELCTRTNTVTLKGALAAIDYIEPLTY